MAALRVEADDSAALAEELKTKNKTLEQENLAKEQEITSLSHKNQLLEAQVEKMETDIKEHKTKAEEGLGHLGTNESLSRKLQVLEEEAETADRNLRETNEKYVYCQLPFLLPLAFHVAHANISTHTGSAKPMSKPATTSARSKLSSSPTPSGRPSTRRL
jgi:hypothetical protein